MNKVFFSSYSKFFFFGFLLLFFLVLNVNEVEAQCAMCRASVENNYNNGKGDASTLLNTGILYLLVMPYLLIAAVGFIWYRNRKKSNGKRTFKIGGYSPN